MLFWQLVGGHVVPVVAESRKVDGPGFVGSPAVKNGRAVLESVKREVGSEHPDVHWIRFYGPYVPRFDAASYDGRKEAGLEKSRAAFLDEMQRCEQLGLRNMAGRNAGHQ